VPGQYNVFFRIYLKVCVCVCVNAL